MKKNLWIVSSSVMNLDLPVRSWNQAAVKTRVCTGWIWNSQVQIWKVGRESHGHCFLGLRQSDIGRLSWRSDNSYRCLLMHFKETGSCIDRKNDQENSMLESSFNTITHQHILCELQRLCYENFDGKRYLTHLAAQILPYQTSSSFQSQKNR